MDIHNIAEDIVFSSVETIFAAINKGGNPDNFCLCDQCRMDTCCYTLNHTEPRYIISHRGFARMEMDAMYRQQVEADIASLIYRGLRLVNHNQRPTGGHGNPSTAITEDAKPSFDIPTIVGRLFDGITFAPIADVTAELYSDGELVAMRNPNWQNPYTLISNAPGIFSFWPALIAAEAVDIHRTFEFLLKVEGSGYEMLNHHFNIPAVSRLHLLSPHARDRTFKLPDLYIFPPDESEQDD